MGASVLQLFVIREGQVVASEVLAEGAYTVGRADDCDVVLADPAIALVHALLQFQDGQVQISESDGGVLVNGVRVTSTVIRSADDVAVGPFLLKTRPLGRRPTAPPPAAKPAPPPVASAPPLPETSTPRAPAPRPLSTLTPRPPAAAATTAAPRPLPAPSTATPAPRAAPPALGPRAVAPLPPFVPASSPQPDHGVLEDGQIAAFAPTPPRGTPMPAFAAAGPPTPTRGIASASAAPRIAPRSAPPVVLASAPAPQRPAPPLQAPIAQPAVAPSMDIEDLDALFDQAIASSPTEARPQPLFSSLEPTPALRPEPPPRPRAAEPPPRAPEPPPLRAEGPPPRAPEPPPRAPEPPPLRAAEPPPLRTEPPPLRPAEAQQTRSLGTPPLRAPEPNGWALSPAQRAPEPPTRTAEPPPRGSEPAPAAAPRSLATGVAPAPRPLDGPSLRTPAGARPVARPSSPRLRPIEPAAKTPPLPLSSPLLHARLFWGKTLLSARSFRAGEAVRVRRFAREDLQLPDFPLFADTRPGGDGWSVQLPGGCAATSLRDGAWKPAVPDASGALELAFGGALRLDSGDFHLDLAAQAPPAPLPRRLAKDTDWRGALLVLTLGLALFAFLRALPPPRPQKAAEPEIIRRVQAQIEKRKEQPKKKKPRLDPSTQAEAPKEKPRLLAEATTLHAASAPLKSLDKISKATKSISGLLASLSMPTSRGAGVRNAPVVPTFNSGPAPLPSLGGNGAGAGPVTRGSELLRGGGTGVLGGTTAGTGAVSGVPISVPSKPSRVQGSIDRDAVAKVINDHVNDMRGCYERQLLRDPNLGPGKVSLEWTINGAGDVTAVRTKVSTVRSPEVVSCLLELLRGMKFPKPSGGLVIVTYPVLFNSVGF